MDHIHAQKYQHNIKKPPLPQIIHNWHGSIGNLRAWPLELNRADGEEPPRFKLSPNFKKKKENNQRSLDIFAGYGLRDAKRLREASFVAEKWEWEHWENSSPEMPEEEDTPSNYLKRIDDYPNCRLELLRAITKRWGALYKEWYVNLKIGDLM